MFRLQYEVGRVFHSAIISVCCGPFLGSNVSFCLLLLHKDRLKTFVGLGRRVRSRSFQFVGVGQYLHSAAAAQRDPSFSYPKTKTMGDDRRTRLKSPSLQPQRILGSVAPHLICPFSVSQLADPIPLFDCEANWSNWVN